jgi:hypothetical protein
MATRPDVPAGIESASERNLRLDVSLVNGLFKFPLKTGCTLAIAFLFATVALAQKGGAPHPPSSPTSDPMAQPQPTMPDGSTDPFQYLTLNTLPPDGTVSADAARLIDSEACNTWTESGVHSPTVSAKRLGVPSKATSEYQKACGAFKNKRLPEAEEHLRKAIEIYPDYSSAWVVLGQVFETENKKDEAVEACSKAQVLDPNYVASYLCLAEFAATDGAWSQLADISNQALAIDPIGNPYALYYAAYAGLHLHQLSQAEMHAQAAVKLDMWHHLPELHLLLAQIYQSAGNIQGEIAQLREFLKTAPNSKDAPTAKTLLAKLDTPPAK